MSIQVIDDSGRRNVCTKVTEMDKARFLVEHRRKFPDGVHYTPDKDRNGRQIQKSTRRTVRFDDDQVAVAVKRSRRWLSKKSSAGRNKPPKHILMAMSVHKSFDPEDFEEYRKRANYGK